MSKKIDKGRREKRVAKEVNIILVVHPKVEQIGNGECERAAKKYAVFMYWKIPILPDNRCRDLI